MHTRHASPLLFALLLALAGCHSPTASKPDLTGTWYGDQMLPPPFHQPTEWVAAWTLSQAGTVVTGSGTVGSMPVTVDGTADGRAVSLTISARYSSQSYWLTGTIHGDTIYASIYDVPVNTDFSYTLYRSR